MNYKAIIFDFDGTMISSADGWTNHIIPKMFRKRGINLKQKIESHIEFGGMTFTQMSQHLIDKYGFKEAVEEISQERIDIATEYFKKYAKLKNKLY